ncbi:MAG: PSD1 and planctomycete cytochrome C domain-containing protein, partial [Verrucomicrobiota bacterium]
EARPGDESILLWLNPDVQAEPGLDAADASIQGLNLSGIDRARHFSGGGSRYETSPPLIARSYAELAAPEKRPTPLSAAASTHLFSTRIKPLFAQKCMACHGENKKKLKGDFDLSTRESLMRGGESGEPAIDLKKPEASLLLDAVAWKNGLDMPPKENDRLSREQIGWIHQWISSGAPWPDNDPADSTRADEQWDQPDVDGRVRVRTSGGTSDGWTNRRYSPRDLWAYQPVARIDVPQPARRSKRRAHPIDGFIARQLAREDLTEALPADHRTLVRRLSYTLTGLPPEAVIPDRSGDRREDLIDRLLADKHYGERMAQHWLDVVRYADSNGFSRDDFRKDAHRYRTYVIESFNRDKPFDRFIREQIAGDELGIANQDALAFLWMGPWEQTAMSVREVTRQLWLDDVTHSIGVTFLGQQLRCASCHDHKFDPIPTRDYYRMQAVFAGTRHHLRSGDFKIQTQAETPFHILTGGALEARGDRVRPGALSVLDATAGYTFERRSDQGSRTALAEWVSDQRNPLTARVMVNRVWQMHFGRGIVATPNDFGKMGVDPTHPELLDWLAGWFMENDWSVKRLHRLILTSETYG